MALCRQRAPFPLHDRHLLVRIADALCRQRNPFGERLRAIGIHGPALPEGSTTKVEPLAPNSRNIAATLAAARPVRPRPHPVSGSTLNGSSTRSGPCDAAEQRANLSFSQPATGSPLRAQMRSERSRSRFLQSQPGFTATPSRPQHASPSRRSVRRRHTSRPSDS